MLDLALTSAVALLVTIDPIGTGPIFAALTRGSDDAHRRRMAIKGVLIAAIILFVFAFVGEFLLRALGIGFPAFRIAGGILLLLLGLDMVREDFLKMFADVESATDAQDVRGYARRRFKRLIVPFAIPLMIGPGAISTVIIVAGEGQEIGPAGTMAALAAIGAAGFVSFVCFALTGPLSRLLGDVGMAVIVRVLGLILCALAIQFIIAGLGEAIPGMFSLGVTAPYPAGGH